MRSSIFVGEIVSAGVGFTSSGTSSGSSAEAMGISLRFSQPGGRDSASATMLDFPSIDML